MGFFNTLLKTASGLGKAITPKEEIIEKPVQIQIVREPARSRKQQFHDMLNNSRDTDGVNKTRNKLDEVCNGTAFNTNCSSSFCTSISPRRSKRSYRSSRSRDFWRT